MGVNFIYLMLRYMKIIPDLCIFVCQQNYALQSLSAALLCRVEYNPVVLIIPPLHPFLSLLVFLSARFSTLLHRPVWLLSPAQWNATSLWSSLHYRWRLPVWGWLAEGKAWPPCTRGLSTQDWKVTRHPASINEKHPHPPQSPGSLHQVECLAPVTHSIAEGY